MTKNTEKQGKDYLFGDDKCSIFLSRYLYEKGIHKNISKIQNNLSNYRNEINAIYLCNLDDKRKISLIRRTKDDYIRRLDIPELKQSDFVKSLMKCCITTYCRKLIRKIVMMQNYYQMCGTMFQNTNIKEEDKNFEDSVNAVLEEKPSEHHVLCSFSNVPIKDCKYCKKFYEEYPYEKTKENENGKQS